MEDQNLLDMPPPCLHVTLSLSRHLTIILTTASLGITWPPSGRAPDLPEGRRVGRAGGGRRWAKVEKVEKGDLGREGGGGSGGTVNRNLPLTPSPSPNPHHSMTCIDTCLLSPHSLLFSSYITSIFSFAYSNSF